MRRGLRILIFVFFLVLFFGFIGPIIDRMALELLAGNKSAVLWTSLLAKVVAISLIFGILIPRKK